MPNIFVANDLIPNKCSLYKESLIYNDNTQRVLLPYIKITEQIIRDVLRLYDAYAECNIFPSFDLGVPNNVIRLAGGFATGSIISWCFSIPFVPVDITLNVCSSSCYYIDNILAKNIGDKLNEKRIIEMTLQGKNKGTGLALLLVITLLCWQRIGTINICYCFILLIVNTKLVMKPCIQP